MGVNTRRPVLPAPTESLVDTIGGSVTGTDLATDISRRTDKTSYSIPDDGSPVTLSTRRHRDRDDKLSSHRDSQTSLLIEYFEGGKGSGGIVSRPSVRVRVTPSGSRKFKDKDHIQITESGSSRKPSYTRRISLTSPSSKPRQLTESNLDEHSGSESNSAEEGQRPSRNLPVEIEFMNRDQGSEMSAISRDARYMPTSDVSSMPADSMLEGASSAGPRRKRSQSLERSAKRGSKDLLKTPSRQRSRSLSHERIVNRVAEKLNESSHDVSSSKKSKSKGRSRNAGKDYLEAEPTKSSSRRRRHGTEDEYIHSPESSLLSTSNVSSNRKSDAYSVRSGASKTSINNPKLLETVEDAIRRLILPELKELKKDQKVMSNTSKFERDMTTSYSSTSSRDELGRRLSKHASAPDVMKPKVVLNKDSKDEGIVLAGEPAAQTKERKSSKTSDTSDAGWVKYNRPDLTEQEKLRRQKSKGLRDAHAAARVGSALTSASLRHHDSQSSIGKKERRASGSQRSVEPEGYNETELVFQKHNVPAMPMHSAIDSELTRTSLLSERTESPTPRKRVSLAEISRGSPRQVVSPTGHTPTRTPLDSRYELGMRHGNQSQRDLSMHSVSDRDLHSKSQSPASDGGNWAIAAAAAANLLDAAQPETHDSYNEPYETGRQLSPIQSVASERTETHGEQYPNKYHTEAQKEIEPRLSIESLSSAPSTNLARSTRQGVSPRSQSGFSKYDEEGPELGYEQSRHVYPEDDIFGHEEESKLSYGQEDSEVDFMDKVKEGQHVTPAIAANPQFVQAMGIESNVASLMDPSILETSILETQSYQSGTGSRSQTDLAQRSRSRSPEKPVNEVYRGSPLKQRQDASSPDETSFTRRMGVTSPPQSVTQSIEDLEEAGMVAAAARGIDRGLESPLPEADQRSQESESEINTNPSIIQGPIGGIAQGNGDHWAYDSRSPPAGQVPYYESNPAGAKDLGAQPRGLDAEYYETARNIFGGDDYYPDQRAQQLFDTSPGAKDEGYVSAANPVSPSVGTPKQGSRGVGAVDAFGAPAEMDEFSAGHQRHFSGYSHGVGSPLYDSATGHGIERIKSKDIVALMDHLTVRDAQRNARDTEMLVTLVRSAAEMRTSFDEMKKFIAQQDELLLDSTEKQHERLNQVLGGPRPLPPSGSRTRQLNLEDDEDLQSKRKNIFKRALKGLSLKSGNDLSKIEGMLEQLLDEVEALRDGQGMTSPRATARMSVDANTFDNNGQNGVAQGSQSPYTSSPARQTNADPRVSTVHEEDEEEGDLDEDDPYMTAHLPVQDFARHERAGSLPLATPPRKPLASGTRSNETTPKASTDKAEKARKHKSSSSSIFPKFSRWSKTTASSMGDNIRNSIQPGRKERPYSENLSRSGSDLGQDAYQKANYYDPEGDDRLHSPYGDEQENRPPSPLVPSQVSEAPKYRAHRGSLDLQHPQPRQGPTGRFQSALETQAQTYATPGSPSSERWGSQPSLQAGQPAQNRFSAGSRLSPISDAGYSEHSSRATGPPRPPKVKDEGPLIPERPPKVLEDEDDQASTTYGDRVISRGSAIRSPPTRKPTGPRPLTSGGSYSPSNIKRTRYRGSPMQIDYEDEY
ncbi:uncharacterized protein N7484_011287 [Penicillium longicatenatum]|uniref:uncharacterized protein n=1 Tax=Penicillium longicatenatum TaxID=1561947 RepID=UPI00254701EC|nr:uncharacterized protein N7484_011287 [Penicillium longicatenatum]KAJ5631187.1 hypothetical protein N7484_011287 [Penicillium longicatenatum]